MRHEIVELTFGKSKVFVSGSFKPGCMPTFDHDGVPATFDIEEIEIIGDNFDFLDWVGNQNGLWWQNLIELCLQKL